MSVVAALASQQLPLYLWSTLPGQPDDLRPGDDQAIVGECFLGAALALTELVETIRQIPRRVTMWPDTGKQGRRPGLAVLLEGADQVLGDSPRDQALLAGRVPGAVQFLTFE